MSYKKYMTTKYDERFAKAKQQGLNWYPWVGKDYGKTGIFVLGHTTGWDCGDINVSRFLVAWINNANDMPLFDYENVDPKDARSFKMFSNMFVNETRCSRAKFWASVAFNNFCQCPVEDRYDQCKCGEESLHAFWETVEIIKPKLVLAWGCRAIDYINPNSHWRDKLGGTFPRVVEASPPIVSVKHPSWFFNRSTWMKYLCETEPVSKKPINDFVTHLKQQIN